MEKIAALMSDRFKRPSRNGNQRRLRGASRPAVPRRPATRRQKESMYQRMFYIGLVFAAAIIISVLGIGAYWEYQVKPNQVLASVNGEEILRKDYWKYQSITLYSQARTYEEYALQVTGQQQTQFLMYAAQFDQMREDVWGSNEVSEATVRQMIEDRLYIAGAEEMGVDLSQPVLTSYALNVFASPDQPLVTPIPTPTMIPERAAWATETQQALQTQQSLALGTPVGFATPGATPMGTPGATPIGSPAATPNPQEAVSRANEEFEQFSEEVLDDAQMSLDEYMELFIKPQAARQQIDAQLLNSVPQRSEQVSVQHILVATEDLANQTFEQISSGANFDEVAKTTSIDTITSPTGGKLGWITREQMPDEFSGVAFSTEPGKVAGPVKTEYGWHVLKVIDKEEDRPMTETQYTLAKNEALRVWIEQQRGKSDISSEYYEPTPAPTSEQFVPPADAPTPIIATPVLARDISGTPVAGPQLIPIGSPAASPIVSPVATPAR